MPTVKSRNTSEFHPDSHRDAPASPALLRAGNVANVANVAKVTGVAEVATLPSAQAQSRPPHGRHLFSRNQARKLMAAVFTLGFNLVPGFALRAGVLRLLGFRIGRHVALHSWLRFFEARRNIVIGSNVTINASCYLDNRLPITIGDNVNISHDVKIYTLGHDVDDPMCKAVGSSVTICDDAWIFPNVLIMPGVTIGRGAVVYPGSVVTRDVDEYDIVGGNPARRIRKRNADIRYRIDYRIWFAR